MAEYLLDHDVSRRFATLLIAHGQVAKSARDERLERSDDGAILLFAAQRSQVLLTHNGRDFWLLHRSWHRWAGAWQVTPFPRHAGIIVLPQRTHLPPELLTPHVVELLGRQPDLTNRLYEWTVARGWVLDAVGADAAPA